MPRENVFGFFRATESSPTSVSTSSARLGGIALAAASINSGCGHCGWVKRLRFEKDADPAHRSVDFAKPLAAESRDAGAVVETHHQPHRRRLAGTVGPEEAGHHTLAGR